MVSKDRGCRKIVGKLVIAGSFLLAAGLYGNSASAMVTGRCDNCHTMHASQDGLDNTEVQIGASTFASWSGGVLAGGDIHAPQARLLKTNCVGCHSNTGTETIVTLGGMKVPIVYNTGDYPANALAGGNFYKVASVGDQYGHNVGGISGPDLTPGMDRAPGGGSGCAASCHQSLALADIDTVAFNYVGLNYSTASRKINGCQACHNKVAHHDPEDNTYRYLGGHGFNGAVDLVDGGGLPAFGTTNNLFEDPKWEQDPNTGNNYYKRQDNKEERDSVGRFCAGCHGLFHSPGATLAEPFSEFGEFNGGDPNTDSLIVANSTPVNPWMRHPTNVNIPNDGEYAQLHGTDYDPLYPVAQDLVGDWGNRDTINVGDQVMCLSCHRAHASEEPDALRFVYTGLEAHPLGGGALINGCFYCHRTKDDV